METFRKSLNTLGELKTPSLSIFAGLLILSGCDGGGAGFDFASTPTTGTGTAECAITTSSPVTTSTIKVSGIGATSTTFSVGLATTTNCNATFTLNGASVTSTNGFSVALLSSGLSAGSNVLIATAGTTTKTWTIYKNTAPTCGAQTPAVTGNSMSPGGSLVLTGAATDADTDTLAFAWKVNGATVPTGELNVFNGIGQSQATFNPTVAYLGSNTLSMQVSDGTDITACNWSVGVAGSCSIASTTPSNVGQTRVSYNVATNTNFQASASTGCLFNWSLNGVPISGATSSSSSGSVASTSISWPAPNGTRATT